MPEVKSLLFCLVCFAALFAAASPISAQDHDHAEMDLHESDHLHENYEAASPRQQSMLMWIFSSLGWRYTLALPLAGLVSFALAVVLVARGGRYAGAALMFAVPLPFIVGMFGAIEGMTTTLNFLAASETAPKPSDVAYGISMALVTPMIGLLLMGPAYLVAMIGLFIRAMAGDGTAKRI